MSFLSCRNHSWIRHFVHLIDFLLKLISNFSHSIFKKSSVTAAADKDGAKYYGSAKILSSLFFIYLFFLSLSFFCSFPLIGFLIFFFLLYPSSLYFSCTFTVVGILILFFLLYPLSLYFSCTFTIVGILIFFFLYLTETKETMIQHSNFKEGGCAA